MSAVAWLLVTVLAFAACSGDDPVEASASSEAANAYEASGFPAEQSGFDQAVQLRGRRPELAGNAAFRRWLETHEIASWYETVRAEDGTRIVVVLSTDEDQVFSARIEERDGPPVSARTLETAAIDLRDLRLTRGMLREAIRSREGRDPAELVRTMRPVVSFVQGAPAVSWEAEIVSPQGELRFFEFSEGGELSPLTPEPAPGAPSSGESTSENDDLGSNELHHPSEFESEALAWTAGVESTQARAQKIHDKVYALYRYDGLDPQAWRFTLSDRIIRERELSRPPPQALGAGVCDEFAVAAISHLRAIGIPARMKLIVWNGAAASKHAALEYYDGSQWRHMDPQMNVFNNPAHYRGLPNVGAVRVMDAVFPDDSRSHLAIAGIPDPDGDEILNSTRDYELVPAYPGEPRPGYSKLPEP